MHEPGPNPGLHYWYPLKKLANPEHVECDVCVFGGHSGGVTAAMQAARDGKRGSLWRHGRHLGGMTASGLGATDIGNKAAIGGLARQFYRDLGKHYGTDEQWTFEPSVAEQLYRQYVEQYKIPVYYEHRLTHVEMDGQRIAALHTDRGTVFHAKVYIDASYEGDLLAAAGVSYAVGREANDQYSENYNGIAYGHPSHNFGVYVDPYRTPGDRSSGLLTHVMDVEEGEQGAGDDSIQAYNFRICLTDRSDIRVPFPKPEGYDPDEFELLRRYIDGGVWDALGLNRRMPKGKTDMNNKGAVGTDMIGRNHDWPEADYETRERIFQGHVRYNQGLLYFVANDERLPDYVHEDARRWALPKDEFPETGHWPHQLYIREARRMVSDYVMTENDCVAARRCEDPIGLAAYTMDSHNCRRLVRGGRAFNEGNVEIRNFPPYPISYRSLVPRRGECENLVVPWALSASHIAFGSIRMEPVFMVLGQTCACAAIQALDQNVAVQDVEYAALRAKLEGEGQVLAWEQTGPHHRLVMPLDR